MTEERLGVLGGGQLGAMLIQSAISFGLRVSVLEQDPQAPCALYSASHTLGNPLDYEAVLDFGEKVDILTIEKEGVNTEALIRLRNSGKKVFPSPEIIAMVQDKWIQKQFLLNHQLPVVPGKFIRNRKELKNAVIQYPVCLKLCREGYDGRGVMILRSEHDLADAFDAPCVLEDYIPIHREIAVIIARSPKGEIRFFDPVSMVFDNEQNILNYQLAPAGLSDVAARQACDLAIRVAKASDLMGIMAVEMFETQSGEIVINELAPRPHNSGHHTIETAITSQYEQLIRCVYDWPLGDTSLTSPSVMINILGRKKDDNGLRKAVESLLSTSNVHVHWYGKEERPGRKLGHITVAGTTLEQVMESAATVKKLLKQ